MCNGKVKDNKLLIWFNTGPVSIHTTLGCLHCNITVALFMIFLKKYPCIFLFRTVFKLYAKSRSWIIYHCLLRSFSSFENIFFIYPNNEVWWLLWCYHWSKVQSLSRTNVNLHYTDCMLWENPMAYRTVFPIKISSNLF